MARYWIHPVSIQNWDFEIANNIFMFGLEKRWTGYAQKIGKGDYLVTYLTKSSKATDKRGGKIPGLFQLSSNISEDTTPLWETGVYPFRASLEVIVMTKNQAEMLDMKSIVPRISAFDNKDNWSGYVRRAAHEITESDFELIRNELLKLQGKSTSSTQTTADMTSLVNQDVDSILYEEYTEGGRMKKLTNVHERNPKLRLAAIQHHGTRCMVCDFDFEEVYGKRGIGYIEVHHLIPISETVKPTKVNPVTDLIVLCCNCHRMIHRYRKCILTPEELKEILSDQKN